VITYYAKFRIPSYLHMISRAARCLLDWDDGRRIPVDRDVRKALPAYPQPQPYETKNKIEKNVFGRKVSRLRRGKHY
jgi:hypothetical protein